MITTSKQISTHFHSTEFRCKCGCGKIYIDENLVNKMEHIFTKLNASKCIISSGYRCPSYDKKIGGFVGKHAEGLAADCIYYDKNNKPIQSKYVICAAFDLKELNGIAKIDDYYTHLDNRVGGTYRGDETRGNNSYWTDPYAYFGVARPSAPTKTVEQLAQEVLEGKHGNGEDRKKSLGSRYAEVQAKVNELCRASVTIKEGDTVSVTGKGTAAADGSGGKTKYFNNKSMKVIVIKGNAYGCNQYVEGNVGDYSKITAWFQASQVKKG